MYMKIIKHTLLYTYEYIGYFTPNNQKTLKIELIDIPPNVFLYQVFEFGKSFLHDFFSHLFLHALKKDTQTSNSFLYTLFPSTSLCNHYDLL